VNIVTRCGLDDHGTRISFATWVGDISKASHPTSYPTDYGDISAGVREDDHSHPSSAEVKNGGVIPPLPNTSSWRSA
jgi:hypothetical protein